MIGWYVHHHGRGHAHRAAAVAGVLSPGTCVTGLSSAPAPDGWTGPWVSLPRDDDPAGDEAVDNGRDPTAGGVVHWAPLGDKGFRHRMAMLAHWVQQAGPELVVVDASVEVTLLLRLLGVPVVVVAAPGDRLDRPHRAAYDAARHLIAPWPGWVVPAGWPGGWAAKTTAVGAFSRDDGRTAGAVQPRTVTVLWGSGGVDIGADQLAAAVRATPAWRWTVLGGSPLPPGVDAHQPGWVRDPWPLLSSAQVVVTHAGQNALAEVAAARRPAVVLPQSRPHAEQETTGAVLTGADLAHVATVWPPAERWPGLLAETAARDGDRWQRWNDGAGAGRAGHTLRKVAASCAPA